jgi:hypothetical protein
LPIGTQDVVLLALLGIAENLVRLLDILEFFFGFPLVGRVLIRMPFARQLAIRALDIFFSRVLGDA